MTIPHDTLFEVLSLFNARAPLCTLLNSATFLKVQQSDVNENSDKQVKPVLQTTSREIEPYKELKIKKSPFFRTKSKK